jgi:hypothetical protein
MRLTENELKVLRFVADWPNQVPPEWRMDSGIAKECGIDAKECAQVIGVLKKCEMLKADYCVQPVGWHVISAMAKGIEYLRETDAKASNRDRVEDAKSWARSSPWTAYPFMALLVLTLVATLVNQLLGVFEKFGWLNAGVNQ